MQAVCLVVLLSGAYPLWRAWRANRFTSLFHAVNWAVIAWLAWLFAILSADSEDHNLKTAVVYLALCLEGCAGIAVLGARRPGVRAWNLVVLGLLLVNALPLVGARIKGLGVDLDLFRVVCVAGTIALGIINYLLTRAAPAATLLAAGSSIELLILLVAQQTEKIGLMSGMVLVAFVPWVAYVSLRTRRLSASQFDQLWLRFRDRFGFVWGERLREQFNRSAAHSGWPVVLRWQGLRLKPGTSLPDDRAQDEILATLRALMKRFWSEGQASAPA